MDQPAIVILDPAENVFQVHAVDASGSVVARPARPSASKRGAQSRTICNVTPPTRAASVRDPPVFDPRQSRQPPRLPGISARLCKPAQIARRVVRPQPDRRHPVEPLLSSMSVQFKRRLGIPLVGQPHGALV